MSPTTPEERTLRHLNEIAAVMLKLGTIAFGGPAVHVAVLREEAQETPRVALSELWERLEQLGAVVSHGVDRGRHCGGGEPLGGGWDQHALQGLPVVETGI